MEVAALLVGAGRGERLRTGLGAAAPAAGKAFARLAGRSLLERAAAALAASAEVDGVVPIVPAEALARLAELAPGLAAIPKLRAPVAGGAERQDSVRAGLAALPAEVAFVAVHDAARPLVRPEDVSRVVRAARAHGAALLAEPARDTVKRVRAGRVVETPPRAECWLAQTPQVFRREWLAEALERAAREGVLGTDDAALVERLGHAVHVVEAGPGNFKITGAEDLLRAEARLAGTGAGGR